MGLKHRIINPIILCLIFYDTKREIYHNMVNMMNIQFKIIVSEGP